MKTFILRWLLKLRYHIEVEGVMPMSEPVTVYSLSKSELDPLILAAYIPSRKGLFMGVPGEGIYHRWIKTALNRFSWISLPIFSERAARFFGRRLLREALPAFKKQHERDWIILIEGENNPLSRALRSEKRRVIFANIEGMEGSRFLITPTRKPFGFWKALFLVIQNGVFWMPKRKVKLTFQEDGEVLLKPKWVAPQEVPDFFWTKRKALVSSSEEVLLKEISRLSKKPVSSIRKEMRLYDDLMLDSLDVTELILTIEKEFHHRIFFQMLETVQDVLDAGKGISRFKKKEEILQEKTIPNWLKPRPDVQPPEGKSIGEAFLRSCGRMGSSLACSDFMTTVSYARLKSLAVGLVDIVNQFPGKEVGLLIPSTGEMYPIIFALILAGKIPVMLNWSQGPFLMDQVLQETDVKVIVTTTAFLQHLPMELSEKAEEKMVLLEEISLGVTFKMRQEALELCRLPTEELLHHFKLDELTGKETAVLLFTSGTEKTPKGVPLSHHNLLSNHRAVLDFVKFTSEDVLFGLLPLFHVYGFSMTGIFPLLIGMKAVYHPSPLDFQGALKQIQRWQVTTVATVPTFMRGLLQSAGGEELKSVRRYVIGAEKPPADLMEMIPTNAEVIEGYGLTECSPVLTLRRAKVDLGVGKLLKGIDCLIVDPESYHPVPQGKAGVILVRGPSIFEGYYRSSIDPFKLINGQKWFDTQDLGFLDEKGYLHLQGRRSRTAKIGGEMISLPLLEDVIVKEFRSKYPALQVAIIGQSDPKKGSHLVLVTNSELILEEVNHALNKAGMSPLLKIAVIEKVASLPLTPLGKIDYKKVM